MTTRLESNIEVCALGVFTGVIQGIYFGMRGSGHDMIALTYYLVLANHHCTHNRIGRSPAPALHGKSYGPTHV
jgi:hypothetical protein